MNAMLTETVFWKHEMGMKQRVEGLNGDESASTKTEDMMWKSKKETYHLVRQFKIKLTFSTHECHHQREGQ